MSSKILVVDDEKVIRSAVKLALEDEGYEVFEAKDGYEAIEMAQEIIPDLVVLDVMMPGKNGYIVCTEIKKDPETRHAYVLLLTARGTQAKYAMRDCGADDLIGKPFEVEDLRIRVQEALEKRKTGD